LGFVNHHLAEDRLPGINLVQGNFPDGVLGLLKSAGRRRNVLRPIGRPDLIGPDLRILRDGLKRHDEAGAGFGHGLGLSREEQKEGEGCQDGKDHTQKNENEAYAPHPYLLCESFNAW
jgi:hypothetical protein